MYYLHCQSITASARFLLGSPPAYTCNYLQWGASRFCDFFFFFFLSSINIQCEQYPIQGLNRVSRNYLEVDILSPRVGRYIL